MDYSLYGLVPNAVLTPATVDELAAALRAASADGAAVVPWGSGTRQHIGAPTSRYTLALRTTALDQIVEYTPADLVVTVQAGVGLGALQRRLAEHGQRLPWDPPAPPEATIGGLLATNASGPLRLGHGPPRDWTLGMQVVLGDGRPVRSGGKVVKNVAGYDAHKLHIGALGTLGVITEVTFKLAPLPQSQRTFTGTFERAERAFAALNALRAAPLEPVSLAATTDDAAAIRVLARFEGTSAAVDRLISIAHSRCTELGSQTSDVLDGEDDEGVWDELTRFAAGDRWGVLLRAGVRPELLPRLADVLGRPAFDWPAVTLLYGGVGLAYARWSVPENSVDLPAALARLRAALAPIGGYAVVEDAPAALRAGLDTWGPPPLTLPLMRALKAQWDSHGVLNPGRYVGGL